MAEICYIDSNVQVQLCTASWAHTLPDSHFFVKIRFGMLRILLCRLARQAISNDTKFLKLIKAFRLYETTDDKIS
jgi:hypothetical protein